MHREFCIDFPKIREQFCIGPTESVLTLLNLIGPPEIHIRGILIHHILYARKALKKLAINRMDNLSTASMAITNISPPKSKYDWIWLDKSGLNTHSKFA